MPLSERLKSHSRRALLLCGLAAGLALTGVSAAHAAPQIGQPAPDFSVVDTAGKTQTLSALRGKVVVLEWTNHDCPYVRKHYGAQNMQQLQQEAKADNVVWLTVISSAPGEQGHVSPAEANTLTRERKAQPAAVVMDPEGKMGRAYGAQTTPHMYVIGADGTLLYMGGIDSIASTRTQDIEKAKPYFRDAMRAAVAGQSVPVAVTRPYGCSVKYVGS
ncbi:thioredoxin family protein [Aquabacter spiritensis]|uniref:Peroxiredoxin n=1 Tax=Aquabacter spiritensis TaxID=933073 RepID=A0A4R3M390_9HYPH|nr:thioredoxin family protein [Aquabacter spiritensis]TCT07694.1 peroxiredoxin [Aquabacter spiritensis]